METREIDILLVQMQYPAMPLPESNITRGWIRQYAKDYDRVEFNVRLGQGAELQPGIPDYTAAQFEKTTKKRADIMAFTGPWVDILEVKQRASLGAIGQLTGYRQLWTDAHPQIIVRRMIVVAQIIDPDVERVYSLNGIQFYKVEPEVRA